MQVRITLKDPDGVYDSIQKAAEKAIAAIEGLEHDGREELVERRREKIGESLRPWIEYGEYVTLEFDLDAGTATVIRQ